MTANISTAYLQSLKERAELESLLDDLLQGMGLHVISRPQAGVRQNGVDMAAVGKDPDDEQKKLFLFVIKSGDISRKMWHDQEQGIRASLEQVLDVYLSTCVSAEHQSLPVKIVVSTGGTLLQTCQADWASFTKRNSVDAKRIVLWDGDTLAHLIDKYRLNEALIPRPARNAFQKLLLLDGCEPSISQNFNKIIAELLGQEVKAKDTKKAFHQIAIILDLLLKWGKANANFRQSKLCSERALLLAWEWGRKHELFNQQKFKTSFSEIYYEYLKAGALYVSNIFPHCCVPDGLIKTKNIKYSLEHHLWLYEIMGHISIHSLNFMDEHISSNLRSKTFISCAHALAHLIQNHPLSISPAYDRHNIEIVAAMLVLSCVDTTKCRAQTWLHDMLDRLCFTYEVLEWSYPCDGDSVETLIEARYGGKDKRKQHTRMSTLFPILAEICIIQRDEIAYEKLISLIKKTYPHTSLQMWHPNELTDSKLYITNAGIETGYTCVEIKLPGNIDELKKEIRITQSKLWDANQLTCFKHDFPIIAWLSARHYHTPLIPLLWRNYILSDVP